MWAKLELCDNVHFILGNVYVPNESSIHYDEEWHNGISSDIIYLSNYSLPFVLIGDFNARTGTMCDFFDEVDESTVKECGLDLARDLPGMYSAKEDLEMMGIELVRHNMDKCINNNGRKLVELCQVFNFTILNGRFGDDKGVGEYTCTTARGQSVIDYTLMSSELLPIIKDFKVDIFDSCLSDSHCPLQITLIGDRTMGDDPDMTADPDVTNAPQHGESTATEVQSQFKTKWTGTLRKAYQSQCDKEVFAMEAQIAEVEAHLEGGILEEREMESVSHMVAAKLLQPAIDLGMTRVTKLRGQVWKKTKRKPGKPWFNEECEIKRRRYMKLKKMLGKQKTQEARDETRTAAKDYKHFIRSKSRKYYHDIHVSLRNMQSSDPREYWRVIQQTGEKENGCDCPLSQLQEHFRGLNTAVEHEDQVYPSDASEERMNGVTRLCDDLLDRPFSLEEVSIARNSLKNHKSAGIDGVINEFLKNCPVSVLSIVTRWFNIVLDSAVVPTDWCNGIITPIYKGKGARHIPDSYRGITLLSCIGKLFTSVINRRLNQLAEQVQLIGPEQAGFRPHHSTVDHGFALHCILSFYLSNRKRIFAAFLDYQKAFDMVDRPSLWQKLINQGVTGKVLQVVQAIYAKAKSCVRTKEGFSTMFDSRVGVRQGENLSPLLFALYINDFKEHVTSKYPGLKDIENAAIAEGLDYLALKKMGVMLYADDTLLLAESEQDLQLALNATSDYCRRWKIKINPTKSKVVVFSRGKIRKIPQFTLNESELEVTFEFNYLGINFSYNNNFKRAVTKRMQHGNKALFALMARITTLDLPLDIESHLFNHMICPVLTYGSEIWGYERVDVMEVFQRKFFKRQMGLRKSTPNCMVYGETGQCPIQCKTDARLLCFWFSLHVNEVSDARNASGKLSCALYQLIRRLWERDAVESKWLDGVKAKLEKIGFGGLWNPPRGDAPDNPRWFKEAVKRRLLDMRYQEWLAEVNSNKHCILYSQFKESMTIVKPLSTMSKYISIVLYRFRCSNMPFPSNYHISNNISQECHLCGAEVGDEFHFILICPRLHNERNAYIGKKYTNDPCVGKLVSLIKSQDESEIQNLSNYLKRISKLL